MIIMIMLLFFNYHIRLYGNVLFNRVLNWGHTGPVRVANHLADFDVVYPLH